MAAADCAQWNADVQAQNRDATVSNVLYVTGGVLAAGAVAAWLFSAEEGRNEGCSVARPRGGSRRWGAAWRVGV